MENLRSPTSDNGITFGTHFPFDNSMYANSENKYMKTENVQNFIKFLKQHKPKILIFLD